jgi:hypothetical protein
MSRTQHWLYPVNAASNNYLLDPATGNRLDVTAENLWAIIDAAPDQVDPWWLNTGYRSMRPDDLVWVYDAGTHQALVAMGRAQRIYQDHDSWHVDLLWDLPTTWALREEPIPRSVYQQVVLSQARANANTSTLLDNWLATRQLTPRPFVGREDEELGDEDTRQRVLREIAQRQGQQTFRALLLQHYQEQCAMSGCTAIEVLEAAHIRPYRGQHTNVLSNGLLLRADLHTLFDLHLLGVDAEYRIVVSDRLKKTEYWQFAGQHIRIPLTTRARPSKKLLGVHLKSLRG